jgi:hypothetical protein
VRYLRELDQLDAVGATAALAAFLQRRIAFAEAERQRRRTMVASSAVMAPVIEIATLFVTENPEGGRRGQAFTAAVLDCAYRNVRLRAINDPNPIDVSAWENDRMVLAVEVKQLPVDESVASALAEDAAEQGCDRALVVALDPAQPTLPRERIRYEALQAHGVLVEVCSSVDELVARVLLAARMPLTEAAVALQEWFAARLQQHGLPEATLERWETLCEGIAV